MKTRFFTIVILIISICFCTNGIQSQSTAPNKSTQVSQTGKDEITNLQSENEDVQQQLKDLEKEVDRYRKDVMAKENQINKNLSRWLAILSIVITLIGVVAPLLLNAKTERFFKKKVDEVKDQTKKVSEQARLIEKQMEKLMEIQWNADEIRSKPDAISENEEVKELLIKAKNEEDPSKAIKLFNRVIELNPESTDALKERGARKQEIKDYEGALRDFVLAIEINPNDADAYFMKSSLLYEMKHYTQALAYLDKAIYIEPNYLYYHLRALINTINGDYEQAVQDYTQALGLNSEAKELFIARAACYEHLASKEQDELKKADYLHLAKSDMKNAREL